MALKAGRIGVHPSQVDLVGKIKMLPFIKRLAPWQSKGKWYFFRIESDGSTANLVKNDLLDSVFTSNTIYFPLGFKPLVFRYVDFDIVNEKSINPYQLRRAGSGKYYANVFTSANFSFIEFCVFGYFENVTSPQTQSEEPLQITARKVAKASKVDEPVEEPTEPIEEPINTDTEE